MPIATMACIPIGEDQTERLGEKYLWKAGEELFFSHSVYNVIKENQLLNLKKLDR